MNTAALAAPITYYPGLEEPEKDEAETAASLTETMLKISETTFADSKHAMRSVHAKSDGLLHGELVIADNLPPELRQGLFAEAGRYPVVMRLSTSPGDILDDKISTPRGLALKVIGVPGARLSDAPAQTSQDFVMVNGPAFQNANAKSFLSNVKLLAATTDKAEGFKKAASAIFRGTEKVIEALGGESAKIKGMGGHPQTHPLGETFYTQVPLRYGDYVAKVSVAPASANLKALTDAPVDLDDAPNGLREAVVSFFSAQSGDWELRVQLCRNLESMPIEDASAVWPEDQSPYITVARIHVAQQDAWSDTASPREEDALAFNPWNALDAHRPLGSINRVRKPVYAGSVDFRSRHNGCPIAEPRSAR